MSVLVKAVGRTREITNTLYIERWVQFNGRTEVIYGTTGDLNRLDALCDSETAGGGGTWWFGGPSPDESTWDRPTTPSWFGQAIRIKFRCVVASGQWHTVYNKLRAFIAAAFPGEIIYEDNEEATRPSHGDAINNPSKFVFWAIEED